jgi:hypothetical protein
VTRSGIEREQKRRQPEKKKKKNHSSSWVSCFLSQIT